MLEFFTAIAAGLCLVYAMLFVVRWNRRKLPPGPTSYTLSGTFFELKNMGFLSAFKKYRQIYGDMFTIRIFGSFAIVCCGYDVIKEVLVTNSDIFRDRNGRPIRDHVFKTRGVIAATGESWKQNRRFALHTLRDFGMGRNKIEMKIHEEIGNLIDAIDKEHGEAFDIRKLLHNAVGNVIASVVFGERFEYEDREFDKYMHRLSEAVGTGLSGKHPWQRHIPGDPFSVRDAIKLYSDMRMFCKKKIEEHCTGVNENNMRDFIDVYFKQMKATSGSQEGVYFNTDQLVTLVQDLFAAGTETTATALRWGLVYLMRDDTVQSSLHKELDSVVLNDRLPASSDKTKLPYLQATILEILRVGNVVPLTTRTASKTTEFRGYTIPKSCTIFINIESALMDSKLWDEPHKFNPSRFLGDAATKSKYETIINFGLGPRVCLGESLARMELFLFLSALLQRYEFLPAEGEDPPTLDYNIGTTRSPKPFKLRAIKRR